MNLKSLYILALAATTLLAGAGCKKDEPLKPGFPMLFQEQFDVQAGLGIFAVHHFYLKNIPTHYDQLLAQHGRTDAQIQAIQLSQATLNGLFGDADYEFIQEVSLRIYDERDPSDFVEVAYRLPVPLDPGNTLPLIPNDIDVKRFLKNARFSIDLALTLRATTQMDTPSRIDLQFNAQF